jgi:hypothetical protein
MLIIPSVPPPKYHKPWSQVIENAFGGLPELTISTQRRAPIRKAAEPPSSPTVEQFTSERERIRQATQTIRWVTPSENDPDRIHEVASTVIEATTEVAEISTPVGAGRMRGLLLHKLIEEVLTGELVEEPIALSIRARELLEQLSLGGGGVKDFPEVEELARTVEGTLSLPDVTTIRSQLVPEMSVYGSTACTRRRRDWKRFQGGPMPWSSRKGACRLWWTGRATSHRAPVTSSATPVNCRIT